MTDFNVNGSNNNFEEYNNQNAKNENKAPEEKEALFEENENAPDEPKSDSVIIRKVDKTSREALEKFFSYKEGGEDKELFGMKVSDIINKLLNGGKQPTPQPDPRPNPVYAVPPEPEPTPIVNKYGIPEPDPFPLPLPVYGIPSEPDEYAEQYDTPLEDEVTELVVMKYGMPEDMDISKGDIAPDVIEGEEPIHHAPVRNRTTDTSNDLIDNTTTDSEVSLIDTNTISNNITNSKTAEDVNESAKSSVDEITEQFNINIDNASSTNEIETSFTYIKANIQATGNMAIAQIDNILNNYDLTSEEKAQYEAQKADIKNMVETQLKEIEERYKEAMKNQNN